MSHPPLCTGALYKNESINASSITTEKLFVTFQLAQRKYSIMVVKKTVAAMKNFVPIGKTFLPASKKSIAVGGYGYIPPIGIQNISTGI